MLPIDTHQDISFVPCPDEDIIETVLTEYNADRDGSQILCAVRKSNTSGNAIINQRCQERFNACGQPLLLWNSEFELFSEAGFRVGDPLLCTKNRRDLDIQNGSTGTLISVEHPSQDANMKSSVGKVKWDDGRLTEITPELVECLELAYAITVHKAQGSAFPRVIIPITSSKILDRTLIYTAITRAERQIIMVGNLDAAKLAVTSPPRSSKRRVALRSLLREQLSAQNAKMS